VATAALFDSFRAGFGGRAGQSPGCFLTDSRTEVNFASGQSFYYNAEQVGAEAMP
jgi:hypothetical protein